VSSHWGSSSSQRLRGKSLSAVARVDMMCALAARIPRSALLDRWLFGGTYSIVI
jgi:hypothetical protein